MRTRARFSGLTVQELVADLRRLGVASGDTVMVHASLRAIGPVDGGAAAVVRALDAGVGAEGTLLMVLSARDDFGWVNSRAEEERAELLRYAEPFDSLETPADPEVGTLAEVFRTLPGTLVSDHPEGRFGARGSRAAQLVSDVPWHDYYGPGSPLQRLVDARGKVLRLGANPDTVTLLHYAEYLAPLSRKRRVRKYRVVKSYGGATVRIVESLDDAEGIAEYPDEDYFAVILREYLATGRPRRGRVGGAPSELLEAQELVEFGATWMGAHLVAFEGSPADDMLGAG